MSKRLLTCTFGEMGNVWAHTDKMPLGVDVVAVWLGDQSAIRWKSGKTGWEVANSCHTES